MCSRIALAPDSCNTFFADNRSVDNRTQRPRPHEPLAAHCVHVFLHQGIVLYRVTAMSDEVSVSREISAPAEQVWAMVADVTRMPEWSPENKSGEWRGGATGPTAGAKFRGTNRNGDRNWKTDAVVTACEPGRRFAFLVKAGPFKVAEWTYSFEPTEEGCRVTETWTDQRSGLTKFISKRVSGVDDRSSHNREGMELTLTRLADATSV
jgi:uncharacterized protein YndB with AHSA1/START domain